MQLDSGDDALYVHIDGIIVLSADERRAEAKRDLISAELGKMGFAYGDAHEGYVGYALCSSPARWEPLPERLGNLDRGIEYVLEREYVAVKCVHTLLSIFVWHRCFGFRNALR